MQEVADRARMKDQSKKMKAVQVSSHGCRDRDADIGLEGRGVAVCTPDDLIAEPSRDWLAGRRKLAGKSWLTSGEQIASLSIHWTMSKTSRCCPPYCRFYTPLANRWP